jgi:hypothetical protein
MEVAMHATLLTLTGAVYREVEVPDPPPAIVEAPDVCVDPTGRARWERRTFVREPAADGSGCLVYREQPTSQAGLSAAPASRPRPTGGPGRRAA